jgi:NAD(P)H-hydrate epimerase
MGHRVIGSKEMTALELNAEYLGVSRLQMMESAGQAVATEIHTKVKTQESTVIVYAGIGGNGGDGMVAARHLASLGHNVTLVLVGKPYQIKRGEVKQNWESITSMVDSIKTVVIEDSALFPELQGDIVVDALLGTGAQGPLRPPVLHAVQKINEMKGLTVAIDIPTGVNADTGEIWSEAVKADFTMTFHNPKLGLINHEEYIGELQIINIGLPIEAETYIGPGDVSLVHKPRSPEAHKGDFGRLLIIGGSGVYSGAPTLAALAALRVGVDLVYLAAPIRTAHDIASISPNLITVKLEGDWLSSQNISFIKRFIERSTGVVIGPGLGLHKDTSEAVKELFTILQETNLPCVLDADGLKAFAEFKTKVNFPLVLTPHAGEYQLLTGTHLPQEIEGKVAHIKETATELGAVLLLKGPIDIVTDGERVKLNRIVHNPGMTVGGTGDVLSGIVGALLSQGFMPFQSAAAGVFINGAAGDYAVCNWGYHILPTDMIDLIPQVMDDPMAHKAIKQNYR